MLIEETQPNRIFSLKTFFSLLMWREEYLRGRYRKYASFEKITLKMIKNGEGIGGGVEVVGKKCPLQSRFATKFLPEKQALLKFLAFQTYSKARL